MSSGFRSRRSCDTQLICTVNDLAKGLDEQQQIDLILLDFAKAFDKVPHRGLLSKLVAAGIDVGTRRWIEDFLRNRTQQVVVNGATSEECPVSSGVPQGTVIGPLLFLIYINDLPSVVSPGTTVRLFADDCAVYRSVKSVHDRDCLQKDIDSLQSWERTWKMEFNASKCHTLHITRKRNYLDTRYTIHDTQLEVKDSAPYLGVNIHHKLSWNSHIDAVAKKADSTRAFIGEPVFLSIRC